MMRAQTNKIVIIGGGPAGATLGILLRRQGKKVLLFNGAKRPPLIVGESLIPGVIPLLRRLGIEAAVKEIGTYKGGAIINLPDAPAWKLDFPLTDISECSYAYNVPRKEFDGILFEKAREEGIEVLELRADLESAADGEVRLTGESCRQAEAYFGQNPDLIIDCSGRSRKIATLLSLPYVKGKRNDQVIFTHKLEVALEYPGYIHLDVTDMGWTWRIPLPDCISVGCVFPADCWLSKGASKDQLLDMLENSPLKQYCGECTVDGKVARYANYQLITGTAAGKNWVLAGDAFGFVDPVFSSGVFLAMKSAFLCAEAICSNRENWQQEYDNNIRSIFSGWESVVASFYDGRFFSMIRAGNSYRLGERQASRITETVARVVAGCADAEDYVFYETILSMSSKHNAPVEMLEGAA